MEGLMSEATDLILSSGRERTTTGPNEVLKWEQSTSKNSTDEDSIALLRLSITNSIKDRSTAQPEVADNHPSTQTKSKRTKGSSHRKPKVDVRFLNSEEDPSVCVVASAFSRKVSDAASDTKDHQNEDEDPGNPQLLSESLNDAAEEAQNFETQKAESDKNDEDKEIIPAYDTEQKATRKKIVENGLKLARRKFSDGIFENCSTYSLTCPEFLQERDNTMLSTQESSPGGNSRFPADDPTTAIANDPAKVNSTDDTDANDCKKSFDNPADDQISLSDSFFVNVDDYASEQKSIFSKESEHSGVSERSSRASLAKENDLPVAEIAPDSGRKSERRHSKRLRKKRKKSKSAKGIPTYDCPKCGVSYVLSTSASDSTARCLHCDFWTSVEPVFLKREKQAWNTCRIC